MNENLEKSVVKIICESRKISWVEPWYKSKTASGTGSGFCIIINGVKSADYKAKSIENKQKFIMTCAHVVGDPRHIFIQKWNDQFYYRAQVEYMMHEADMAILSLIPTDKNIVNKFWDKMPAIPMGGFSKKSSTVYALGYPDGGDNISITKGVISRIATIIYPDSKTSGTALQIDTPTNPGNSGGPAVMNNKITGMVFCGNPDREGMGFIIPTFIIQYFIESIKRGSFKGERRRFVGLSQNNIEYQSSDGNEIRNILKMPNNVSGPLITEPGFARGALQRNDILTHINDIPLDNYGNVFLKYLYPKKKRDNIGNFDFIPFKSMISIMFPNDVIKFTIFRDSKIITQITPVISRKLLIPHFSYQLEPGYVIVAGLAFVSLSKMLIETMYNMYYNIGRLNPIPGVDETVVLSKILKRGNDPGAYTGALPACLFSVNGIAIKSLKHLNSVIKKICKKGEKPRPVIFRFYNVSSIIIINSKDIAKYTSAAMMENGISKRYVPTA